MRWRNLRRSHQIDDRRGVIGTRRARGGIVGIIIAVVAILMGADPQMVMSLLSTNSSPTASHQIRQNDQAKDFAAAVLATTEDAWAQIFAKHNKQYQKPVLTLFTGAVRSGCGNASADMGPFYCPADGKLYIDLGFFDELASAHQAGGDFAAAYVIAHEVGHHVQNLLGLSRKIHAQRVRLNVRAGNELSVRQELQADCYAGVWAHYAARMNLLETGDLAEALNAALQIGDDTLQKKARGRVVPESFTHGSGAQRQRWFKAGYQYGSLQRCDTFAAKTL